MPRRWRGAMDVDHIPSLRNGPPKLRVAKTGGFAPQSELEFYRQEFLKSSKSFLLTASSIFGRMRWRSRRVASIIAFRPRPIS